MNDRYLGTKQQGVDEQIAYSVTTTAIGSAPTSPSVKVYQVAGATYTDVRLRSCHRDRRRCQATTSCCQS